MIKIYKIALTVLSVFVVGAFLSLASGLWNPAWNPFKPASGDVLVKSLSKSLEAKTFQFNVLLEIEAEAAVAALGGDDNQPKNIKIALEAREQIDRTEPENIKANAQINLGMEAEGVTISGNLEGRCFGDNIYLKIVSLPSFLPLPIDIEQIKGKWIQLNIKDLQDKLIAAGFDLPSPESQDFQTSLKTLQEITKGKKFFEIKRHFGKEKVFNVMSEHYSVELNKRAVKDFIPAYLELIEKSAPQDQKQDFKQQLDNLKSDLDANFEQYWMVLNGLQFDIWVEQASGRLVKLVWEKDIDPAKLGKIQQEIKKMKLRIELALSQFNEKFEFEEPFDFKSAEEIIQGFAEAPATSTTSTLP